MIDSPNDPQLESLCEELAGLSKRLDDSDLKQDLLPAWPTRQLELVAEAGVYRWFIPQSLGGLGWSSTDIISGYVKLSAVCLTTTFIITQRVAAIKRICASANQALLDRMLPGLLSGAVTATVGISHLTTSRRHVCLLYTSPSPRDRTRSRMPSSA